MDILQLHKTTPSALAGDAVPRAFEHAQSLGIATIGASVSDEESARLAIRNPAFGIIQLPYYAGQERFGPVMESAAARDMQVAVNRPFGMGRMLYQAESLSRADAFAWILRMAFRGVVLSGTKSPQHLRENREAFQAAQVQRVALDR